MKKYAYKLKEEPFKIGDKSVDKDVQSTITNVDDTTGSVTWDIKKLPSIKTVFKKFKELSSSMDVLDKDTDDTTIDDINDKIKHLFNQYRTHVRKNYSKSYSSPGVKEISISSGAGSYLSKATSPIKKKLEEESESQIEIFQTKRIKKFDELEGRLLNIKKKIRQGKLATIKYYRENPTHWSVVYGTDLIEEYFNDIETLLSDNTE